MNLHTSYEIGGPAQLYALPASQAETIRLLLFALEHEVPWMVVGKGSNLLVSDDGIAGLVISTDAYHKLTRDENYISAFCGVSLKELCDFAQENGLSGLEFASGIPGSVGGAVFMNAGAYGGEIKDILYCSKALHPVVESLSSDNPVLHIKAEEHDFGYRSSAFQRKGWFHLSSVFKLEYADPDEIKARMDDLHQQRWSKQPMEYPSGGSTFKRPEGYFAGKLIQDCGLRGYSIGGAQVSEKHCGFIINKGGATARDVSDLIQHIQATVLERFGVELQTEIRKVGRW
jgi:UDP-N-acetylmuramate dehydrogenase